MRMSASAVAVNRRDQGANLDGDHASGVSTLALTTVYPFAATGQVKVGDETYAYSTEPDDEANTITLDSATTAAYEHDAPVSIYPLQPVYFATVNPGSDQPGINALVPHNLVPLLAVQMLDATVGGIPVTIDETDTAGFSWMVSEIPGRSTNIYATQTPILVETEDGESMRIDGDGITARTNDFGPTAVLAGTKVYVDSTMASADGDVYFVDSTTQRIHKYNAETRQGGLLVTGLFGSIAADGNYVYAAEAGTADIYKYDAVTGAQVGAGALIVGTFAIVGGLATDGNYVYAVANSNRDIYKYDAVTGAQVGAGALIVGTFQEIATDGTYVYAIVGGDIFKYDAVTGAQIGGGALVPTMTFAALAADGTYVYGKEGNAIYKYDAATGALVDSIWVPRSSTVLGQTWLAADEHVVATYDRDMGVVICPGFDGSLPTVTTDTSTGTIRFGRADADPGVLTNSQQVQTDATASPTSTTNVGLSLADTLALRSKGTTDVFWISLYADVTITVASTINIVEVLVGGVVVLQLVTRGPAAMRVGGAKRIRLTGLAAGVHNVTARTRNTAGATGADVAIGTLVGWEWAQ